MASCSVGPAPGAGVTGGANGIGLPRGASGIARFVSASAAAVGGDVEVLAPDHLRAAMAARAAAVAALYA